MLIEENKSPKSRLRRILSLKCPNCGYANVFLKAKFPGMRPQMKEVCEHCGHKFGDREAGFFRGAVYFSYGLSLVEGLLAFFLARFLIFGLSYRDAILIALTAMLFLGGYNYRFARVLWIGNKQT